MMRQVGLLSSILSLSVAAACSSETGPISGPQVDADAASFANASRTIERRPRYTVYLTMPDGAPTGFRGDGRLANGTPSNGGPSVYEAGVCGVAGSIFWGGTNFGGDATLDPDKDRDPKCAPARKLDIAPFGLIGPHVNWRAIMQLEVNESRLHQLTMTADQPGCYALRYTGLVEDENGNVTQVDGGHGSAVRVTRLKGSTAEDDPGVWVAVSEGTHRAGCYSYSKGVYTYTGVSYYLPMHVLIEELR